MRQSPLLLLLLKPVVYRIEKCKCQRKKGSSSHLLLPDLLCERFLARTPACHVGDQTGRVHDASLQQTDEKHEGAAWCFCRESVRHSMLNVMPAALAVDCSASE